MLNYVLFQTSMEHAEDALSNGPIFGEVNHSQGQNNPPPPPPRQDRLEAAMAVLLENQNALMQWQMAHQGGAGNNLLDHFRHLHSLDFGGSVDPVEA